MCTGMQRTPLLRSVGGKKPFHILEQPCCYALSRSHVIPSSSSKVIDPSVSPPSSPRTSNKQQQLHPQLKGKPSNDLLYDNLPLGPKLGMAPCKAFLLRQENN